MSDNPEAPEAAEATEQPEAAGQPDPPSPTDPAEAAAAEEAAIQAEIVAEANGEAPPTQEEQEETGEEGETESSQEETDEQTDSSEAAAEAAAEEGAGAAEAHGRDQPSGAEAAEAQDDIWANSSDEQRAALEELTKKAATAEQGKRSAEGRESGLKRRLDALMAGDGQKKPDKSATTTRQPSEDDKSAQTSGALTNELKEFAEEYPEISKPILKALGHLEGEIGKRDAHIQRLESGLQQIGTERHHANLAGQEQIVYEAHPDYDDVAGSDEFVAWMQEQSPAMQAIIAPNIEDIVNGDDVAFVVERYKASQGIVNGGTDGASTAGEPQPKAETGKRKPAADPVRRIQRRSAAAPRSSPGAAAREAPRQETEEEVRREILQAEQKRTAAEARA